MVAGQAGTVRAMATAAPTVMRDPLTAIMITRPPMGTAQKLDIIIPIAATGMAIAITSIAGTTVAGGAIGRVDSAKDTYAIARIAVAGKPAAMAATRTRRPQARIMSLATA